MTDPCTDWQESLERGRSKSNPGAKGGTMGKGIKSLWFLVLFLLCVPDISFSGSADVLPKGVWSLGIANNYYPSITKRYGPDGDVEDVAADYNATLGSSVFPDLALIEAGFGLPPGSANIGRSVVSLEYDFNILYTTLAYGITDRLTIGVQIPYWWAKNNVDAHVDTTNATVGKNPLFGTPGDPFGGVPVVPISLGGLPFTDDDVQNLLGPGLSINGQLALRGLGYKRVETWSGDGVGDIDAALKYQYFKSDDWRLAFTGGLRFPTGEIDDPDNLVDYGFGKGAWGLLFFFNNDYTGVKNLVLDATLNYYLILPQKETLRILDDPSQILSARKEELDRNFGDVVELEASASYEFLPGASASILYQYGYKFEDSVKNSQGHLEGLEKESGYTEHIYIIGLSYSTIPLFQKKQFPVPLSVSLKYRNRFAGDNRIFKSDYIDLGLQVYF